MTAQGSKKIFEIMANIFEMAGKFNAHTAARVRHAYDARYMNVEIGRLEPEVKPGLWGKGRFRLYVASAQTQVGQLALGQRFRIARRSFWSIRREPVTE